jgi:CubicO group peptidase (beta-lactamase class C family)
MVQWLRLQLGDGTYAGKTIVDKAVMEETHTPHTPMPLSAEIRKKCPSAHLAAYALAWVVQDYQGRLFLWHTGAIDGMRSMVGFVPEERLGLVVLTNCDNQALHTAVFHRALDTFLGTPPQDWSAMAMEEQKKDEALLAEELRKIKEARAAGTHPTLPLSAYTGNFEDDLYGRIKLTQEGDHLVLQYGAHLVGDLAHWHYDTFRLTWRDEAADSKIAPDSDQGAALVPFTLDALGKVTGFSLGDMADFKRVPEPKEASQK